MWKEFKPKCHSVIFAFNVSGYLGDIAVSNMVANSPCDWQVARMNGVFNELKETSYQLDKRHINWKTLTSLLHVTQQQMILHVDIDGNAYAGVKENNYEIDMDTVSCGTFTRVSEDVAKESKDYTHCQKLDAYYILVKD